MKTELTHKTKLVCTIGPACDSLQMLKKMIGAGMNIARLNFSHGDFESHGETIKKIREAALKTGRDIAILADLPGPKMRIGTFLKESVTLKKGEQFTLTTQKVSGDRTKVSITMKELPRAVKRGDTIFLNDGLIELRVEKSSATDITCRIMAGGVLRSRKGINIPGINPGVSVFTKRDKECMKFALEKGVDAIAQSFVNCAADIKKIKRAAAKAGYNPFVFAKLERASALDNLDEILETADGVMVARGDLGVEIPIENIAAAQKQIIARANVYGKPVITATQMLESMTSNPRPTRAESTDVANAILDGTDCVMLSEESAMGSYPLQAVKMLSKIATAIEPGRMYNHFDMILRNGVSGQIPDIADLLAMSIENFLEHTDGVAAILCPTSSGYMARSLARFRLPVWILAVSSLKKTCRELLFSYGVFPVLNNDNSEGWTKTANEFMSKLALKGNIIIKAEGPSSDHPDINHQMEIIPVSKGRWHKE
jgi:pyruvate kinase